MVERHRFLTREQLPGESVDQNVTKLRTLPASCEWGDLKDDLICSRIVSGILPRIVREAFARVGLKTRKSCRDLQSRRDVKTTDEVIWQRDKLC